MKDYDYEAGNTGEALGISIEEWVKCTDTIADEIVSVIAQGMFKGKVDVIGLTETLETMLREDEVLLRYVCKSFIDHTVNEFAGMTVNQMRARQGVDPIPEPEGIWVNGKVKCKKPKGGIQ